MQSADGVNEYREALAYLGACKTLVLEIANESPITSGANEVNYCKFCEVSWAEGDWKFYLENAALLQEDPDAKDGIGRIAWDHHKSECLWVRANKIIRRL